MRGGRHPHLSSRRAWRNAVSRATAIGAPAVALWSALALLTVRAGALPPLQLVAMTLAIAGGIGIAVCVFGGRNGVSEGVPAGAWMLGAAGLFGDHAVCFAAWALTPAVETNLITDLRTLLMVLFGAEPSARRGAVGCGSRSLPGCGTARLLRPSRLRDDALARGRRPARGAGARARPGRACVLRLGSRGQATAICA
jgi:hypothetical protein